MIGKCRPDGHREMQPESLESAFEAVIHESVTEPLRTRGFVKADWLYTRGAGGLTHAVEVQLGKYNDDRKRAFTINLGIIPEGWVELVHPECMEEDPGLGRFPHRGPVHLPVNCGSRSSAPEQSPAKWTGASAVSKCGRDGSG